MPPCLYRTGQILGSGTFSIVKEVVHLETGKRYACKIISKKRTKADRERVLGEIDILKELSGGTSNMIFLTDYFETTRNIYLCIDLCTGDLFSRVCRRGRYFDHDAAILVHSILVDLSYIHSLDIVHRDLKPENILLRTSKNNSVAMIADFGLAQKLVKGETLNDICGTPKFMAPEILNKTGYGKPVDIWAMGMVTYFLLTGQTLFEDQNSMKGADKKTIISWVLKFEPKHWINVSPSAQDFIWHCLIVDPNARFKVKDCLEHEWLASAIQRPQFDSDLRNRAGDSSSLPMFSASC